MTLAAAIVLAPTVPRASLPGLHASDFLGMAVRLGAVRSLQKPFKPRDLIAAVRQCLGDTGAKSTGTASGP